MNYAETDGEDTVTVEAPKPKKRRKQNGKYRYIYLDRDTKFLWFSYILLQMYVFLTQFYCMCHYINRKDRQLYT